MSLTFWVAWSGEFGAGGEGSRGETNWLGRDISDTAECTFLAEPILAGSLGIQRHWASGGRGHQRVVGRRQQAACELGQQGQGR